MSTITLIFTIIFLIASLVLIVSVLMQSGKSAGLSGSIGGGAEQLFGKQKGRSMDAMFEKMTAIAAVAFMLSAIILLVLQKYN
ncbi:MAG: preprotein translocase subunit SecG [Tissierellia bacterium]|jgi:preprotein translocase subunit SecG|nr:preprotein translocase subunit SecG [Tissierellia bacterium]